MLQAIAQAGTAEVLSVYQQIDVLLSCREHLFAQTHVRAASTGKQTAGNQGTKFTQDIPAHLAAGAGPQVTA